MMVKNEVMTIESEVDSLFMVTLYPFLGHHARAQRWSHWPGIHSNQG